MAENDNDDDVTVDDDETSDDDKSLFNEDLVIDNSDDDEDDSEDDDKKTADTVSKADFDALKTDLDSTKSEMQKLRTDKTSLNKALHEARQKKAPKEEDAPLSDEQLLKILSDNDGDPQTILNIVKYQATQAARQISGEVVSDADIKKKSEDAAGMLDEMYPSLSDQTSEMRQAIDATKKHYGLDGNPLGDLYATGVKVLEGLPDLIAAAEERGKKEGLADRADNNRKDKIKSNLSVKKGSKGSSKGLSSSQEEAAGQMGLSPAQLKTYQKLVAGKATTVQVKE